MRGTKKFTDTSGVPALRALVVVPWVSGVVTTLVMIGVAAMIAGAWSGMLGRPHRARRRAGEPASPRR